MQQVREANKAISLAAMARGTFQRGYGMTVELCCQQRAEESYEIFKARITEYTRQ
jgi:hypothetical protein